MKGDHVNLKTAREARQLAKRAPCRVVRRDFGKERQEICCFFGVGHIWLRAVCISGTIGERFRREQ